MSLVPTRLLILKRLTAHLEAITPANGYSYDLTDKIERGRVLLGAEVTSKDKLPMLSIVEAPRPDVAIYTAEWNSMVSDNWTLLIQGLIKDDKRHPTDTAYELCAEVQKHLARLIETRPETGNARYPNEHLLGGLISRLEMAPPVVRPPEKEVSQSAFFFLPIRVGVAMDLTKPFTVV